MIYIGIDASTTCTGYSVFEDNKLIDYGAIKPKGSDWRERLVHEGPELKLLFEKYKPDKIYMENVPLMGRQMETLVILGAVQGYILGIVAPLGFNIEFLWPTTWRSDIGLYDGTKEGRKKEVLKEKAVDKANQLFNLDLKWYGPKSKRNDDDIAESILICYSQIAKNLFGKKKA